MITEITPFLCTLHNLGQPWTILRPIPSTSPWLLFFTEKPAISALCCHLWTELRNQFVAGVVPKHPDSYAPPTVAVWSLFFGDSLNYFGESSDTCRLHYIATNNNTEWIVHTGRWENARSCNHTRCSNKLLTHKREFPKACKITE